MRKWSIKTKVTFWYVFFLIIFVVLVLSALIYASNYLRQQDIKDDLVTAVEDSINDIKIQNNQLNIDDDIVTYRDGTYILVYGENNFIITGDLPEGLQSEIPFIADNLRKVTDKKQHYYVYDHLINDPDFKDIWIRGITSADMASADPAAVFMLKIFFIIFPLLIIIAALGGYYITQRAFKPVAQITATAEDIQSGENISNRIDIEFKENSKDELYDMALTFNNMLDRLEAAFQAEKQFSNDASHELRTPVSVIIAQCEYALKKDVSDETQESLSVIYEQAKKMSQLIAQLLTLARADRNAAVLEVEEVDVSELVEMVCLDQETAAEEKSIELARSIAPNIHGHLDQTLIMRLFINLISNSIQYGREHGTTSIVLDRRENQLIFIVSDDGVGIAEKELSKIWDRFYQVNPSRANDSVGLGLSMVKWIVQAHSGDITVTSKLGEGSVFTVILPLEKGEP